MKKFLSLLIVLLVPTTPLFSGDEYRVEAFIQQPPAEVADSIRGELQASGVRVLKGNDPLCEIWFRKSIPTEPPKGIARSYPQIPDAALLGAVRVIGSMRDNRNNSFPNAVYTIRHGLQPQDGNHVGSSEFVDFALLLNAKNDRTLDGSFASPREMITRSMSDGGAGHPVVFAMLPSASKSQPSIAVNEHERWVLEAKSGDLVLALVIVGVYEH